MIWLYWAFAIAGAIFTVPMLIGGLDFDGDIGEVDVGDIELGEIEIGTDLDTQVDTHGATSVPGDAGLLGSLLSFRSGVLGLMFFGLTGVFFSWRDSAGPLGTVALALLIGVIAWVFNSAAMQYLYKTDSSSHVTASDLTGSIGRVMLPVGPVTMGKIKVQLTGHTETLTARLHRDSHGELVVGSEVVVVELVDGVATVAPFGAQ